MRMARISYWVPALGLLPLLLTGCSDPVPPASQGAVALSFSDPDPPATTLCSNKGAKTAPILVAGNVRTTATNKGTESTDQQNGDFVSCSVTPGGGGYIVTASIDSKVGSQQIHVSITNLTIREGQSDATGMLSVLLDDTSLYSSPTTDPCKFSVSGGALGVGPGKIWGSVTCTGLLESGSVDRATCKNTGYFIFENCVQ
jgi:hypothetical protein